MQSIKHSEDRMVSLDFVHLQMRSFSQQLSLNISLEGENYDGLWEKQ